MMNHDNRHYSFLGLRYCSSVGKEMFILGLSLDSPHFFQLLAKQCFKHWTYRSLFVSWINLVPCYQFQLPVHVHNPYLIPKWLHFNCKWKKTQGWSNRQRNTYIIPSNISKDSSCLHQGVTSCDFPKLGRYMKRAFIPFWCLYSLKEKNAIFFLEVWAQKYSFKY